MTCLIHKAKLGLTLGEAQELTLPCDSEILSAAFQGDDLCIWYKFRWLKSGTTDTRSFIVVFTGVMFDAVVVKHIATLEHRDYMFHVFEIR